MKHSTHRNIPALTVMFVGLGFTVVATLVPFVTDALADHVRSGYPAYSQAKVDAAVTAWRAVLTVVGTLGVLLWLGTIRIVFSGRRWASAIAVAAWVLGLTVAVTGLLIEDTSGDTGLPALLGWLGVGPCLPGLIAIVLLRRGTRPPE